MTYKELLKYLKTLDKKQLEQEVQIFGPEYQKITALKPVIAIDTVENLELDYARSSVDNKFHANEIVMMYDYNPFGRDGATSYSFKKNAKNFLDKKNRISHYAKGKTSIKDQKNPNYKYKELPETEHLILKNRIKQMDKKKMSN